MFGFENPTSWPKIHIYADNPFSASYFLFPKVHRTPSENPSDIPRHLVEESVLKHHSDRYYKTMTTYKQLVFLFYGIVMRCKSLNNLCKNLLLLEDKLTYLGINELPAVSTL